MVENVELLLDFLILIPVNFGFFSKGKIFGGILGNLQ